MKQYLFIIALVCGLPTLKAQPAFFEIAFGETAATEKAVAIRQLPDGSIYAAGSTTLGNLGGTDFTLSKLSANGNLLWTKYLGTPLNDQCAYMVLTDDGNLILAGDTETPEGDSDGLLIKTDTSGNVLFTAYTPASVLMESLSFIQQTTDGGFITGGFQTDTLGGNLGNNCLVVKFSSTGSVEWQHSYGGSHNDVLYMIRQTPDGGYVFTGDTESFSTTNNVDIWVVKTDAAGNQLWDLVIGNEWANGIKSILVTAQNDYLITGETVIDTTGLFDLVIARVTGNGELLWYKTWGLDNSTEAGFSALQTPDGGFLITGYSNRFRPGDPINMVLLKTDTDGNVLGAKYFGSNSIDIGYDVQASVYGYYLLAGMSYVGGNGQYYLHYTAEPESTTVPDLPKEATEAVQLLPNYTFFSQTQSNLPIVNINLSEPCYVQIQLLSSQGKLMYSLPVTAILPAGRHQLPLPQLQLSAGIYFCTTLLTNVKGQTKKFNPKWFLFR